MNRRTVIAIAAATMLAAPAAALATSTAARTGSFDAMGTGTLVAQGKLRVFGTIKGTVLVRDRTGKAVVKIAGVRQKPKRVLVGGKAVRVYLIKRVDGAFYAKGEDIKVELRAPKATLSMSAFGRGRITLLDGEGTYHLNGLDEEQWTSALLPLAITPPEPENKPPTDGDGPR